LEVVGVEAEEACLVKVTVKPAETPGQALRLAFGRRLAWTACIAVVKAFPQGHDARAFVPRPHSGGSIQKVICAKGQGTLRVPPLDRVASRIQDDTPRAAVKALGTQPIVFKVEDVAEGNPPELVDKAEQVSADVIHGAG